MTKPVWTPGVIVPAEQLTPAYILGIKTALSPAQVLAITMWREAEARFENGYWVPNPIDAMVDIMEVIDYRALDPRWRMRGHKGVCLYPEAFSCWEPNGGPDDPKDADVLSENFEVVMYAAQRMLSGWKPVGKLMECLMHAQRCVAGELVHLLPPRTTHYHATWIQPPTWAYEAGKGSRLREPVARRWGHVFYAGVP